MQWKAVLSRPQIALDLNVMPMEKKDHLENTKHLFWCIIKNAECAFIQRLAVCETVSVFICIPQRAQIKKAGKLPSLPPTLPIICCRSTCNEIISVHITLTLIISLGNVQLTAHLMFRVWMSLGISSSITELHCCDMSYITLNSLVWCQYLTTDIDEKLFSLNNLLWNLTGGDITSERMHGFCLHCRVLRHTHTFLPVLFVFQPFPSAAVVMTFLNHYLSLSNHIHFYTWSNSNIVLPFHYFYFFITCALITFHYRNQL